MEAAVADASQISQAENNTSQLTPVSYQPLVDYFRQPESEIKVYMTKKLTTLTDALPEKKDTKQEKGAEESIEALTRLLGNGEVYYKDTYILISLLGGDRSAYNRKKILSEEDSLQAERVNTGLVRIRNFLEQERTEREHGNEPTTQLQPLENAQEKEQFLERLERRLTKPENPDQIADAFEAAGQRCSVQELERLIEAFVNADHRFKGSEAYWAVEALNQVITRESEVSDVLGDLIDQQLIILSLRHFLKLQEDFEESAFGLESFDEKLAELGKISNRSDGIEKVRKGVIARIHFEEMVHSFEKNPQAVNVMRKIINVDTEDLQSLYLKFHGYFTFGNEVIELCTSLINSPEECYRLGIQVEDVQAMQLVLAPQYRFLDRQGGDGNNLLDLGYDKKLSKDVDPQNFNARTFFIPEIGVIKLLDEKTTGEISEVEIREMMISLKKNLPEDYFGKPPGLRTYRFVHSTKIPRQHAVSWRYATVPISDNTSDKETAYHEAIHHIYKINIFHKLILPEIDEGLAITGEEYASPYFPSIKEKKFSYYKKEFYSQYGVIDRTTLSDRGLILSPLDLSRKIIAIAPLDAVKKQEEIQALNKLTQSDYEGPEEYIFGPALIKSLREMKDQLPSAVINTWQYDDPAIEIFSRTKRTSDIDFTYETVSGKKIAIKNAEELLHIIIQDMGFLGNIRDSQSLFYQLFQRVTDKITTFTEELPSNPENMLESI